MSDAKADDPESQTPDARRPRRGSPEQTRALLVETAAKVFNSVPYTETDTNQLAKQAGYATGTFYRHFKDKREIFIAAFELFLEDEWASIQKGVMSGGSAAEAIDAAIDALISFHRRWRVFRANVKAVSTYDEELRLLTLKKRREELMQISTLRQAMNAPARSLEVDAVHAIMFERICEAIADGDFRAMGMSAREAQQVFRGLMRRYLQDMN